MDFYPTFAALGGASLPQDRVIDGNNLWSLISSEQPSVRSPHEVFFYYLRNRLEAVRDRRWKLHVCKGDRPVRELYDLELDPGETTNVYDSYPEIVRELTDRLQECREDIGDELTGTVGRNIRPIGRVDNPDTLTHYDRRHPYMMALYDLKDRG
jgi:arylsulfatase